MEKPWAGRFRKKTEKTVEDFTSSLKFDVRLWKHDIQGSIAHVKMLEKQKIIPRKDARVIIRGLKEIASEIQHGTFVFHEDLEDIHMNVEQALIKKTGPVGGKIHTARSRNDQVALDLRLYLRDETGAILRLIRDMQKALLHVAEKHSDVLMPGYTHMQRAQPVLLSHHLLAYIEMLQRDRLRFEDSLSRLNVLPLGAAALAGTGLPVDRKYVAQLLGFPAVSENSIDAVSDRDFVIEFLSAAGILMVHLSRLSEEMILWNTEEFGFIELPDEYATGSSIMPQKKNPDVFELTRGRSGRVFGHLMALLTVMKGLPLAYNRDMQEDKEPVFDTVDTVRACLGMLAELMPVVRFRKEVMARAAEAGFLTATDVAEYLVTRGMPFREAHQLTGHIVSYCLKKKKDLMHLTKQEWKTFSLLFRDDIAGQITVKKSIDRKQSYGGTARKAVMQRIRRLRKQF